TARTARCRERDLSDDCPGRLVAASIRRNFLFPAPCPFRSRTGKRRHDTVDHSSIVPSAALAESGPPSLAASSSYQSAQNDLPPAPPRDQIPWPASCSPPARGFVLRRLSDAGPETGVVDCSRQAGIRNPNRNRASRRGQQSD